MNKFFSPPFLIRIGLALVFLANSLAAFFAPQEIGEIIERAFFAGIVPVSTGTFAMIIGVNDALVAMLLFGGVKVRIVAVWAALWIVGVMAARAAPLDILEESGFLAMALALAVDRKYPGGVSYRKQNHES